MAYTNYELITDKSPKHLAAKVNDAIASGKQPIGELIYNQNDDVWGQPVAAGAPAGVMPANGSSATVTNSAGDAPRSASLVVTNGELASVKLAATVATVATGEELTVPVTGVYATKATVTVANGVIAGIALS